MSGTDEFWGDDAAAVKRREAELATGLRMPKASDTRIVSTGVAHPRTPATRKRSLLPLVVTAVAAVVGVMGVVMYARSPVVTLAEFDALQAGMTVDECNAVVGATGVTAEEAVLPPTTFMFQRFETIEWVNSDKSSAAAGFVDGKLISKAQERLK